MLCIMPIKNIKLEFRDPAVSLFSEKRLFSAHDRRLTSAAILKTLCSIYCISARFPAVRLNNLILKYLSFCK